MNTKQLLKQIKLKKGVKQLIFISKDCGLNREDLEQIPYKLIGKENLFVLVSGNLLELIKVVKSK